MIVSKNPDTGGIHGTIKIDGVGQFSIENCGDPDCHLILKKVDANALHPTFDRNDLLTDDSQLPTEVE